MKRPHQSSYPMEVEEREELARELNEFGYREHASNDLGRAQAVFASVAKCRPRGRYSLRQGIRILQRWPPDRD
jgi:hypothetical protein